MNNGDSNNESIEFIEIEHIKGSKEYLNQLACESLFIAVSNGEIETVRELLAEDTDLNIVDENNVSLLQSAVSNGEIETVRELLAEEDTDVNIVDENNVSLLQSAVYDNNVEIVRQLIAAGADVNVVDMGGYNLLLLAVSNSDTEIEMVTELITAGIDVNEADIEGNTALLIAVKGQKIEIVIELIVAGANVHIANIKNETPIDIAPDYIRNLMEKIIATRNSKDANTKEIKNFFREYSTQIKEIDCLRNSDKTNDNDLGALDVFINNAFNQDPNSENRFFYKFMLTGNRKKESHLKRKGCFMKSSAKRKKKYVKTRIFIR